MRSIHTVQFLGPTLLKFKAVSHAKQHFYQLKQRQKNNWISEKKSVRLPLCFYKRQYQTVGSQYNQIIQLIEAPLTRIRFDRKRYRLRSINENATIVLHLHIVFLSFSYRYQPSTRKR